MLQTFLSFVDQSKLYFVFFRKIKLMHTSSGGLSDQFSRWVGPKGFNNWDSHFFEFCM